MAKYEDVHAFVNNMEFIPQSVFVKLQAYDDSVNEVTPPALNETVWYVGEGKGKEAEVIETSRSGFKELYTVKTNDGVEHIASTDDLEPIRDDFFPMWGTMFVPEDLDQMRMRNNKDNIMQKIADIGFRIYDTEDFGYVLGIDAAGFDFYERYWFPLYDLFMEG